ncbi:MAG: hypothetical protein JW982_11770 [Spirochaetes bacterium]|nr:hypothetical protein [Spirochaetota bacterium]
MNLMTIITGFKRKNFVLIILLFFLSGCISLNKADNKFVSLFPTDADIFGWKVIRKPSGVQEKSLKFINHDIENYNIQKTFYCLYESINNPENRISAYICKTDNPVVSYSIINNEMTKSYKSLSKTTIFSEKILIAFKGSYVIVISATFMDDDVYAAFNDFLYFFNEHIDDDARIPAEITNFNFDEITFYPKKFNIFTSGYFIYYHSYQNDNVDVYFSISDTAFNAKTEFYSRIKAGSKYVIWSSNGIESAFIETDGTFTFTACEGRILFSIYNIESLEKGKDIIRELITKFRNVK